MVTYQLVHLLTCLFGFLTTRKLKNIIDDETVSSGIKVTLGIMSLLYFCLICLQFDAMYGG